MRTTVVSLLANDTVLKADPYNLTEAGVLAGDVDTPVVRPFIQVRFGTTERGVGVPGASHDRRLMTVWLHDIADQNGRGDYTRIDGMLRRVKAIFYDVAGVEDPDGSWISIIQWVSDSDDLSDTGHGTITRNATFYVGASGI